MPVSPTAVRHGLTPAQASKPAIERFAGEIGVVLSFNPGDALEPIAADLGGTIGYRNPVSSRGSIPGSIVVRSEDGVTIYLGAMNSSERDRLTIAHELGHFFVHDPSFVEAHPGAPWSRHDGSTTPTNRIGGGSGRRVGSPPHFSCPRRRSRTLARDWTCRALPGCLRGRLGGGRAQEDKSGSMAVPQGPNYRVRLFLSVDLVGSTMFKAGRGGEGTNDTHPIWVNEARKFCHEFQTSSPRHVAASSTRASRRTSSDSPPNCGRRSGTRSSFAAGSRTSAIWHNASTPS